MASLSRIYLVSSLNLHHQVWPLPLTPSLLLSLLHSHFKRSQFCEHQCDRMHWQICFEDALLESGSFTQHKSQTLRCCLPSFFYLLSLPMVFSLCKTWVKCNEPSFSGLSLFIINSLWCVSSGLAISIASHDICSFTKCRKNVECFMIVHICFHVHVVSSHNRLAFCLCVPNHCEKLALGKS